MAIQTATHADILRSNASRPETAITVQDPLIQTGGHLWKGWFNPSDSENIPLLALTSALSWVEVSWTQPTTVLGVQFCGDDNDGGARILVDGEMAWEGNTHGGGDKFTDYLEISGLTSAPHTIRVEATGQAGRDGGNIHVTVTAFGWGSVAEENKKETEHRVFMPWTPT